MDTQALLTWSVVGILACQVIGLIAVIVSAVMVMRVVKMAQQELGPAVQAAKASIAKVETLTDATQQIMHDSVKPVLTNVEESTQAIRQSTAGVRRMVVRVEDAVAKPIAIMATAGKVLETPAGKAGLLALGLGVARYAAAKGAAGRPAPIRSNGRNGH